MSEWSDISVEDNVSDWNNMSVRIMCQSGATYLWRIMYQWSDISVEDNVSVEQHICGG